MQKLIDARREIDRRQADLVRDIFHNPFQPLRLHAGDLGGKKSVVVKIAHTVYEEHRFGDMPILADALEDAGCTDSELLAHCRAPTEHARLLGARCGFLGHS